MRTVVLIVLVVAVIAVVVLLVSRRSLHEQGPTDEDVIEQLRRAGSDLSKPHPIDFYVYLPSEEAAKRVSGVLSAEGYTIKVQPAAKGPGWLALASKNLVPTSKALSDVRRRLTALALAEQGDYDGWEAKVVK